MPNVYVLIEDYLDSPSSGEIFAIVKDKQTAQQFIKDYQQDQGNYMCDLHYEKWNIVDKY